MATPHGGGTTGGHTGGTSGDDSVDVGKEVGETIEPLIPWAISVLFHAGILLLACFLVVITAVDKIDDEQIVPSIRLSKHPGGRVKMFEVTQRIPQNPSENPAGESPKSYKGFRVANPGPKTGPGVPFFQKGPGGAGPGGEGDSVGPISLGPSGFSAKPGPAFTRGLSSGLGPPSSFMQSGSDGGGNAYRIVYLIDASGSLIDTLPFVLMELKRSITMLSPEQKFTVIFFRGNEPLEVAVGAKGLKPANDDMKKKVCAWVDPGAGNVIPAGLSNPVKAISLALSYQPQLIYLLSDNITGRGRYEVDQRWLLREIARANKLGTRINTTQFLRADPLSTKGNGGTMELIAKQSGGQFNFVGARELNIQ